MASGRGSKVITMGALVGDDRPPNLQPVLMLRSSTQSSRNEGWNIPSFRQLFNWSADETVDLSGMEDAVNKLTEEAATSSDPDALKKNRAKLDKIFERIKDDFNKKLQEKKEDASKAMEHMTPDQQEQLLTFWGGLREVFKAFMDWIDRTLTNLIDMLKKGWTLVKETTKAFFKTIIDWFKSLG